MKKRSHIIENAIQKLTDGDIYTPIIIEGTGSLRLTLKRLEQLRIMLLDSRDQLCALEEKHKISTASLVHDLKTPLAVISGYAESVQDGMNDKDYINLIIQKTSQMNESVQSLVDASRRELQEEKSIREKVDAANYFLNELKKYNSLAESKKIKYKFSKAPKMALRIDKNEFARVIQNLISNAVKYTKPKGKIKVWFRHSGKYIKIHIKDNGEGIEKDSLPLIFDKFYREDKARTTANSGLGLYISKEIVTSHGGTISVKSKKTKGSHFIVKIPVEPKIGAVKTATQKFDALPRVSKFFVFFYLGFILCSLYRIVKFFETQNVSTLVFGILCIALFPFVWFLDIASILVYNKIVFLSE